MKATAALNNRKLSDFAELRQMVISHCSLMKKIPK